MFWETVLGVSGVQNLESILMKLVLHLRKVEGGLITLACDLSRFGKMFDGGGASTSLWGDLQSQACVCDWEVLVFEKSVGNLVKL